MWTLFKTAVGAALLGVLAYLLFFVDLGGESLASHLADVWRSPIVQEKQKIVRDAVEKKIEDRLAAEAGRVGSPAGAALTDEPGEHDRTSLDELLKKSGHAPRLATPLASE